MADLSGSVGILGGSFNPVHNAHLRMAIEAREALGLDRVELVPAPVPPHKEESGLLPFSMRVELLRLAVADIPGLAVNDIEGEMPGPSYTYATLSRLAAVRPDCNHVFILGSTEVPTLLFWHRGLELPLLTDMAVVDRLGQSADLIDAFLTEHWSWHRDGDGVRHIAGGRRMFVLNMPRSDISSSLVRARFLRGKEIAGLVPESVRCRLQTEHELVRACWVR